MDKLDYLSAMVTRVRTQACLSGVCRGDWDLWQAWEEEYNPQHVLLQRVKEARIKEFQAWMRDNIRF